MHTINEDDAAVAMTVGPQIITLFDTSVSVRVSRSMQWREFMTVTNALLKDYFTAAVVFRSDWELLVEDVKDLKRLNEDVM